MTKPIGFDHSSVNGSTLKQTKISYVNRWVFVWVVVSIKKVYALMPALNFWSARNMGWPWQHALNQEEYLQLYIYYNSAVTVYNAGTNDNGALTIVPSNECFHLSTPGVRCTKQNTTKPLVDLVNELYNLRLRAQSPIFFPSSISHEGELSRNIILLIELMTITKPMQLQLSWIRNRSFYLFTWTCQNPLFTTQKFS